MTPLEHLRAHPNALAAHYQRFKVSERYLLTGHSHQAWPDVAEQGILEAFADAALLVDDKWTRAFDKAARVERGFAERIGDTSGSIALTTNTHDALVRFLSALPLMQKRRIVTTDQEFHSLRRQLDRLAEAGVDVVRVPHAPIETLGERLFARSHEGTACVMVSSVSFLSGLLVPDLRTLASRLAERGIELFVDAYHQVNVAPLAVTRDLDSAFVVGGGYKYCQLGEGVCFLRVPSGRSFRPVVTGWFAEYGALAEKTERVTYADGAKSFLGATYDPVSHYRAARVFDFFDAQGLTVPFLRSISQHQVGRLADAFLAAGTDPQRARIDPVPLEARAGFLAVRTPDAARLSQALAKRGVHTDYRGDTLRLGPAPYLSDAQLDHAMAELRAAV